MCGHFLVNLRSSFSLRDLVPVTMCGISYIQNYIKHLVIAK